MAADRLGDMTRHELRALVEQIIDERLHARTRPYRQHSDRPLADILESIRKNAIVSRPGDPSLTAMLREDRDR